MAPVSVLGLFAPWRSLMIIANLNFPAVVTSLYPMLDKGNLYIPILETVAGVCGACHHDSAVRVPASIGKLKVVLAKGDAEIYDLPLPLDIRALRGDVVVRNAARPLSIRAMKGKIAIDLADVYAGKSDVSAMDGDIGVTTAAQFSGRVEAKVGKGDIRISSQGLKSKAAKNAFFRSESVELGGGSAGNILNLRTMHGDLTVNTRVDGR